MKKVSVVLVFFILYLNIPNTHSQEKDFKIFDSFDKEDKKFTGEVLSFDVAKESGEYLVAVADNNKMLLLYFDVSGKKIWEKYISEKTTIVKISDNGQTILTEAHEGGFKVRSSFFDKMGNLLWSHISKKGFFLSPNGQLFSYQNYGDFESGTEFQLFKKNGETLWKELPQEYRTGEFFIRIIDDKRVLVLKKNNKKGVVKQKLMMLNIADLSIEWEYSIGKPVWIINYNSYNTASIGKSIIFFGRGTDSISNPTIIYSFGLDGTLKWKNENIFYADKVELSIDEKYVLVYSSTSKGDFYILDNTSGIILEKIKITPYLTSLISAIIYKDNLIVSGKTFNDYRTNYYLFDSNIKIQNEYSKLGLTKFSYMNNKSAFVRAFSDVEQKTIHINKTY